MVIAVMMRTRFRHHTSVDLLAIRGLAAQQLQDRLHYTLPDSLTVRVPAREAFASTLGGDNGRVRTAMPLDEQARGAPEVDVHNRHIEF